MINLFYSLIAWALSSALARILTGAGLTLVLYAGVDNAVQALLDSISGYISGLPATAIQLMELCGIGQGVSILGSAVMTRIGLTMAGNLAGVKKLA